MISKKEKKDYVFGQLNEVLLPQGYKLFPSGGDPRYVLNQEERVIYFYFNFTDFSGIGFSKINICIKPVEEIVFEIKKPNQNYDFVDNKRSFLTTIEDKINYPPSHLWIGANDQSIENIKVFTSWVIHYLANEGKAFIEKYSYLPNILEEMEENTRNGVNWSYGILRGNAVPFFSGLIIAKLCNDPKIDDKIKYVDWVYYTKENNLSEYIPYYEKLKERLKSVEPIYNVF